MPQLALPAGMVRRTVAVTMGSDEKMGDKGLMEPDKRGGFRRRIEGGRLLGLGDESILKLSNEHFYGIVPTTKDTIYHKFRYATIILKKHIFVSVRA